METPTWEQGRENDLDYEVRMGWDRKAMFQDRHKKIANRRESMEVIGKPQLSNGTKWSPGRDPKCKKRNGWRHETGSKERKNPETTDCGERSTTEVVKRQRGETLRVEERPRRTADLVGAFVANGRATPNAGDESWGQWHGSGFISYCR